MLFHGLHLQMWVVFDKISKTHPAPRPPHLPSEAEWNNRDDTAYQCIVQTQLDSFHSIHASDLDKVTNAKKFSALCLKYHETIDLTSGNVYLTNMKIQHSKKMLAAGSSVTDACYQSGFHNMSTFNNAFRNLVHMTPSAYRKSVKESVQA